MTSASQRPVSGPRLHSVELVRGCAALAVCWYHLTNENDLFRDGGWVPASGTYGYLGVHAFFAVSGFVVPYALFHSGYSLRWFGRFLSKRLLRLEPPYLAAVALVLASNAIVPLLPGATGYPAPVDPMRVMSHLGYAWWIFGYEPLDRPYWTLAVEFQFYLFAGLAYAGWASRNLWVRLPATCGPVLACVVAFTLPATRNVVSLDTVLIAWLPLFAMGTCGFHYHVGLSSARELLVSIGLSTVVCGMFIGWPEAAAGLTAVIAILAVPQSVPPVFLWLGSISYSLYLVHMPIGGRVINLGLRFSPDLKVVFLAVALVISLAAAWALWWLVERPARTWSARVRYRPASSLPVSPFVR